MNTRRAAVIVIVVTLIALAPVVPHEFTSWDDNYNIVLNPYVNPPSIDGLKYVWTNEWMHLWIPLTYTIWIAIAAMKFDPHWYHAANLLIHVLSSVATLVVLRRLNFSVAAATIGALVFAVHPMQVEPVAWVSGLKDVLCGLLCLVSIACYLEATNRFRYRFVVWYGAAILAFILAMLAKPQAAALPIVVSVIDWWMRERSMKEILAMVAPMLLVAVPFIVIGKIVQPASLVEHVPLWWRPLVAGDALTFYSWKLVRPFSLAVDYGRTPRWVIESRIGFVAWIVPVVLLIVARKRSMRTALLVFIAALLPVLGLVTFDFQQYSTVADRYLYLAMLGPAIAVAAWYEHIRPAVRPVFFVIVVLLGAASFVQSRNWADSRTLFNHALEVNPNSFVAHNNLFVLAMDERNGAEAEALAVRMLEIKPDDMYSTTNLGGALAMQGRYDEAESRYREALKRWPDRVEPHVGLGLVLLDTNRRRDAVESFDAALRITPDAPDILELRAKAMR